MKNNILILLLGMILLSCSGTKNFQKESRFEISYDSIGQNKKLIREVFYTKNGIREKEFIYNSSPTLTEKTILFDSEGNKTNEISYYDSAKTYGSEMIYKYDNNILNQVYAIDIVESGKVDTLIIDFMNELDSLERLTKSTSIIENDTNIVEYQYTDFNEISNVLSKTGNQFISYENYYYNNKMQKQEYILRIPDYNIEKHEYYEYGDSLLLQIVSVNNNDTLRIDRFGYDSRGLKKSIEVTDYKSKEVKHIEIEYE